MNSELLQISVDLALISRVSLGILWGILWATYLQFNRYGQFLVEKRTWVTVVVGIGVDLIISYPWIGGKGDWFTVTAVISASSIGIISRSLINEQKRDELNPKSYKLIWGIEDALALTKDVIDLLVKLLESGQLNKEEILKISEILGILHRLKSIIIDARRGDYNPKNGTKTK